MNRVAFVSLALCILATPAVFADAVEHRLESYRAAGAGDFDPRAGERLWNGEHSAADGSSRRCGTCHTDDLHATGKHATTGKAIDPLAPSANLERLTDERKIEKWFKRNCKWTWGRECTPQEKGDLLVFIRSR